MTMYTKRANVSRVCVCLLLYKVYLPVLLHGASKKHIIKVLLFDAAKFNDSKYIIHPFPFGIA